MRERKRERGRERERERERADMYHPTLLGDIQRRPASQSGKSDCNYKITIRTGASRDAGTSARVYVTLRGSKGELKRRRLTRGGRREFSFAPGSLERFRIRGKDVGELKQITGKFTITPLLYDTCTCIVK